MRFVKKNRIIHLQIQEGELTSRANIDNSTLRWVPLEDYHVSDKNVKNKVDFHKLTWEERTLDLDDLTADGNQVMTGRLLLLTPTITKRFLANSSLNFLFSDRCQI